MNVVDSFYTDLDNLTRTLQFKPLQGSSGLPFPLYLTSGEKLLVDLNLLSIPPLGNDHLSATTIGSGPERGCCKAVISNFTNFTFYKLICREIFSMKNLILLVKLFLLTQTDVNRLPEQNPQLIFVF
jgi:hypothetical protein